MDPFDDILPVAPAARARPGGKFMPKAKSKQLSRKEISASEHATPSKDGKIEQVALPSTSMDAEGTSRNECHNAVASTLSTSAEESMEDGTNSEMGNPQQVSVKRDTAALVDAPPSMITASEVDADWDFTNLAKSACEVESVEFELDPFSNDLLDPGARNAHKFLPKIKPRPRAGTTPAIASVSSNVMVEKSAELPTCTNEVQSFKPSGDGSSGLNQSTDLPLPTAEIMRTTDLPHKFDHMSSSIPFSEGNSRLEAVIPSQLDSPNPMLSEVADHNGTRDWPSSFGKPAGETADIFSGLESLDDFITQAATDTGKPALHTSEENFAIPACDVVNSFGICDTTQVQKCPEHHTIQDSLTFNETAVLNEGDARTNNRRSEAEDANLRKEDGTFSSSLRKHKRSSIAGEEDKDRKPSRQLRKQAARKPANNSVNEDVQDGDDLDPPYNPNRDELEENDDEFEVNNSSKKQRASTRSKNKSVAKSGKTSQKQKKAKDLEKTTKPPSKKFSHSTRRKKRCVDKALLEIPEDELDPLTLPIKDIILLAEHREQLAKKEASTSKTSSTSKSGGDFRHEADANNEEEMLGSDPIDDEGGEKITSTASLYNYQSFMDKAPRGKWSKQDTDLFYKAIRQFGTDFSMVQQLFPGRTRHQIKLKYKKEERQHPLLLSDALNNRAQDDSHFKLVIERLQQASTKVEQDPSRDASDFIIGEEVEDLTPVTNDEVAATEQDAKVKDQLDQDANVKDQVDSVVFRSLEQSDDSDDDFQRWSQYKSNY